VNAFILTGARVLLPEPAPPACDAVAVADGRIVHVGTTEQCHAALPSAVAIDVAGRTVAPGFVDAHTHPMIMSVFDQHLRFDEGAAVGSIADVLTMVAERARATDTTVIGFGLDDALLAERRLPTAAELDRAGGGVPVVLMRRDGHHAVASTAALAAAGLDRPGAVPAGGHIELADDGRPTGLVGERAVEPLLGLLPEPSIESLATAAAKWTARLLGQGITALTAFCQTSAEGPSGEAGEFEAVGWSALVDALPFDVQTVLIGGDPALVDDFRAIPALHAPHRRRRVDGIKLFLDGTLGGATACMHSPFADRPDTSGMRTLGDDVAYARMVAAHVAGLQICIHAIGDEANRAAAQLFARLLAEHPGPHRHRVEHASVLDDATIAAYATIGITCVVQPIDIRTEAHWLRQRLGAERIERAYPLRSLIDAGVTVAGSSDAPIEATDVLAAMDAACHRRGIADAQSITPLEALRAYTTGAAHARCQDGEVGRIEAGHRADLVVLSADPLSAAPQMTASLAAAPATISVDATCIGGTFHHSTLAAIPCR
jgi:predicted amidohydrolase YtcJ